MNGISWITILFLLIADVASAKGGGGGGSRGSGGSTSDGGSGEGSIVVLYVVVAIFILVFICIISGWAYDRRATIKFEERYYAEVAKTEEDMSKFRHVPLLPPSGPWEGSFTEQGIDHASTYHLTFTTENSIFGRTDDKDGKFDIEGQVLIQDKGGMQFLWLEKQSGCCGKRTMCCGDVFKSGNSWQIIGTYETSHKTTGNIRCKPTIA